MTDNLLFYYLLFILFNWLTVCVPFCTQRALIYYFIAYIIYLFVFIIIFSNLSLRNLYHSSEKSLTHTHTI